MKHWIASLPPLQLLLYGYLMLLLLGFLLLCLPWFHAAPVSTLDNLFIATSALSTTGLATISIGIEYNLGGQLIILLLIQVGGLGYMSIGSFILLMKKRQLSAQHSTLLKYDFSLPESFNVLTFLRDLVLITLMVEFIGAVLLGLIFWQAGDQHAIWSGIFHSISAFCTAGFSLYANGFEGFLDNFYLNAVISLLSITGALGFIVFTDIHQRLLQKKQHLTFTSKIILRSTFVGLVIGTAVIFLSDTAVSPLPAEDRLLASFFQSMTAFTTVGFNTYPISNMVAAPSFFLILLMVVGASPAGTGGGLKVTSLTAMYALLRSTFRGDQEVKFMRSKIPDHRVRLAASNFFFYVIVICIGTYLLLLVQSQPTFDVLFEAVSALGTVGLSRGITGDLSVLGKLIITAMMFLGRIGPLSFGMVLFHPETEVQQPSQEEDLAI
jgi:trk system potassium uptake protein TrkH